MILHVVASYTYLGHYITGGLSDDDDINRQRRTLFVQGNNILRKFNMCSLGVKLTLFRTYCSPIYTAQLWWNYRKSTITKLQIAYHNIFLNVYWHVQNESTSYLCTLFDIKCCQSVIRKLVYGFMCRLDSFNCIIKDIYPGIHPGYVNTGVVYYILIVDRSIYVAHIVYNLHVMLDDFFFIINQNYGPQIVMYYLYA